jgi:large subunit ribosomal protein L31
MLDGSKHTNYNSTVMKKNIHPKYYNDVKVTCLSCGNTFLTGSTLESLTTELCSNCHPFYTGVEKIVDTDNLVAKYNERQSKANESFKSKRQKMSERKQKMQSEPKNTSQGLTLKDMLASIGK